jgi:hypothetical protein
MRDWCKEDHCRKGKRRRYETHFGSRGAVESTSSNDRSEDRRKDVHRAEKQTFARILVRLVLAWGHVKARVCWFRFWIISCANRGAKILPTGRDLSMNFFVDAISLCRTIAISGRLLQLRDLATGRAGDVIFAVNRALEPSLGARGHELEHCRCSPGASDQSVIAYARLEYLSQNFPKATTIGRPGHRTSVVKPPSNNLQTKRGLGKGNFRLHSTTGNESPQRGQGNEGYRASARPNLRDKSLNFRGLDLAKWGKVRSRQQCRMYGRQSRGAVTLTANCLYT